MTDSTGKEAGQKGKGDKGPNLFDMESYRKQRGTRANAMGSFRQQYYEKSDSKSKRGKGAKGAGRWRMRLIVGFQVAVLVFGMFLLMRGCST